MSILDLLMKRKESIPELEPSLPAIDAEIKQELEDIDETEENIREAVFADPKKVDQLTQTITQKRMRIEALKIAKSAVNDQIALLKKKEADAAIAAKMAEARETNRLLRDDYFEIHKLASALADRLRQAKERRVAIHNANAFAVEAKRPELKVTPILSVLATALSRFNPPLVVKIRDAAGKDMGRKWGTYVKTTLSLIFSWGLERGYVDSNPALRIKGIKKPKDAPDANRPWADTERHLVLAEAPTDPVNLLLPISLMMFCGLDPGDVVKLPKAAIKNGYIDTKRGKTKQPVWLPLPQPVKDVLAGSNEHKAMTVCASSDGTPWTYSGLDAAWQRLRAKLLKKKLIEPGLTLKGLRHTVATILAEMGYDAQTIADMLGQKTIEMARHYSKRADKRQKLTAVIKNFDEEMVKRRTKVV